LPAGCGLTGFRPRYRIPAGSPPDRRRIAAVQATGLLDTEPEQPF
jgi:hypothetical protein